MSGRLTVSLSALAANYATLKAHARGDVAAVVKADGYGLGAAAIASKLRSQGCSEFFVATCDEGIQLRQALPEETIYVLEGAHAQSLQALINANLTPVLNTPAQCAAWSATSRPAAVHVDTGMQRLGLPYAQAVQILEQSNLTPTVLVSHFARADEPQHPSVAEQLSRINPVFETLRESCPSLRLSLCNSAALLQGVGPEHLGRAGIGLYGGNPYDDQPNPMQPVVTMHARVLQVREVASGVAVGYGGSYVTASATRLAILGVGYADGLPRLLSNKGRVWLAGQYCPIVGRVSMDLTAVDVGSLVVEEGDEAEIFGSHVPVDEVAHHAQTIAYEILTGVSRRMVRAYLG